MARMQAPVSIGRYYRPPYPTVRGGEELPVDPGDVASFEAAGFQAVPEAPGGVEVTRLKRPIPPQFAAHAGKRKKGEPTAVPSEPTTPPEPSTPTPGEAREHEQPPEPSPAADVPLVQSVDERREPGE